LSGGPLLEIFKFFGMKLETVCHITDFETLWNEQDYIELDFLGFGIGKFHMPGVKRFTWPVLSNPLCQSVLYAARPKIDRLGRSLIFHKDKDLEDEAEEEGGFYNFSEAERRLTSAAKCISAMVNGAWIKRDLMMICRAVVERVKIIHRMQMGMAEFDAKIAEHLDPGASRTPIRVDVIDFPDITALVRIFSREDLPLLGELTEDAM